MRAACCKNRRLSLHKPDGGIRRSQGDAMYAIREYPVNRP
ncbi:hypothetical protein HMPREF9141_0965 [Prevotella multiformis DSM 16608]|uniref:Uncharacterized protein n=1 Tax=Prevotella multiformis DSM 16608 TaxID=888743 RepID=F0F5U9_9BACT|nr:hypothetical protein HMPREF9141_0965 [Prevotella multiformis DSM 16608]